MELAKKWNVPIYETSALARINVEEVFYQLVREIRKDQIGNSKAPAGRKGRAAGGRGGGGCSLL